MFTYKNCTFHSAQKASIDRMSTASNRNCLLLTLVVIHYNNIKYNKSLESIYMYGNDTNWYEKINEVDEILYHISLKQLPMTLKIIK